MAGFVGPFERGGEGEGRRGGSGLGEGRGGGDGGEGGEEGEEEGCGLHFWVGVGCDLLVWWCGSGGC